MRNRGFTLWALPPPIANIPAPQKQPRLSTVHQHGEAPLAAPHASTGLAGPASPHICGI